MGREAPGHSSPPVVLFEVICLWSSLFLFNGVEKEGNLLVGLLLGEALLVWWGLRVDVLCFFLLLKNPLILAAEHSRGVWSTLGLSLVCLS